jgi:hypothetical protein
MGGTYVEVGAVDGSHLECLCDVGRQVVDGENDEMSEDVEADADYFLLLEQDIPGPLIPREESAHQKQAP